MDLGLNGKVAIVTGASRGVGRAIAFALAAEGCRLSIIARGREALDETADQLWSGGTETLAIDADLTVAQNCKSQDFVGGFCTIIRAMRYTWRRWFLSLSVREDYSHGETTRTTHSPFGRTTGTSICSL